jgi:uncharacterized membrane protein
MGLKSVMEKTCVWCVVATLVALSLLAVIWMISLAQLIQ